MPQILPGVARHWWLASADVWVLSTIDQTMCRLRVHHTMPGMLQFPSDVCYTCSKSIYQGMRVSAASSPTCQLALQHIEWILANTTPCCSTSCSSRLTQQLLKGWVRGP